MISTYAQLPYQAKEKEIRDANDHVIGWVYSGSSNPSLDDEIKARENAIKWAAADELLEACQAAYDHIADTAGTDNHLAEMLLAATTKASLGICRAPIKNWNNVAKIVRGDVA